MAQANRPMMYKYALHESANDVIAVKAGVHRQTGAKIVWHHLQNMHKQFREMCGINIPLNWWHALMYTSLEDGDPKRSYTTAKELFAKCQVLNWGSDKFPQDVRGGKAKGIMTIMQDMTQKTFKMGHPETWELRNQNSSGLFEFAVLPSLYALDQVLVVLCTQQRIQMVPRTSKEAAAIANRIGMAAGENMKQYYLNFRKNFALVMKERDTPVVASEHWKRACGWDDDYGYNVGKLTASLDNIFGRALAAIPDVPTGRQALYGVFERACPILTNLDITRKVAYYPRFVVKSSGKVYGGERQTTGMTLITKEWQEYWFLWKWGEDHHPILPDYNGWLIFFGHAEEYAQVIRNLESFFVWAVTLASGSGDWRGITDERVERTWGLQVASRLIWLLEEVGILRSQIFGGRKPFHMMGINGHTLKLETLFDVKEFAKRYAGQIQKLLDGCSEPERLLATTCEEIRWADPREATMIQAKILSWSKQLRRERPETREAGHGEYWAAAAAEMAGKGHFGGRQVVAPPLDIAPRNPEAVALTKRPAPREVPAPDADDVQVDNQPPKKRQKVQQDVSMAGPINVHPQAPINAVACPGGAKLPDPSRPHHQGGMAAHPEGRDGHAEQSHPRGNVVGGNVQIDDEEMPVAGGDRGSEVVRARSSQSSRKSRVDRDKSRELDRLVKKIDGSPERGRPSQRSRSGSLEDLTRDRSRSRSRSKPSRSRRRSDSFEDLTLATPLHARSVIADHPQASQSSGISDDVATMVQGLVAKYASRLGSEARAMITQKIAMIAQPQQLSQSFRLRAEPQKNDFATRGRQASGYWLYNDSMDGRVYGLVRGFAPPSNSGPATFHVQVVGGQRDGSFETLNMGDGVYRPDGPFPVLAFANAGTSHGKILRVDHARLKDQRLALTKAVVDEMVRREVNSMEVPELQGAAVARGERHRDLRAGGPRALRQKNKLEPVHRAAAVGQPGHGHEVRGRELQKPWHGAPAVAARAGVHQERQARGADVGGLRPRRAAAGGAQIQVGGGAGGVPQDARPEGGRGGSAPGEAGWRRTAEH